MEPPIPEPRRASRQEVRNRLNYQHFRIVKTICKHFFPTILTLVLFFRACPSASASDEPTTRATANLMDLTAVHDADAGWWTASMKTRDARLQWWREARFGCFIHWGVYSGPGGVWNGHSSGTYAEHLMRTQKIPLQEYKKVVVSVFDPEKFEADRWVALIKAAGMRYVVITAKHHDGFAMWPSQVSKYNIRDATKFKRDPMRELCDACRSNGIRFGFYYSHAFDWEDPNAPGNDWDYQNPGGDRKLFGGAKWYDVHPELLPRVQSYVDDKAIPQLKELIVRYKPDILWFDTPEKLPLFLQLRVIRAVREADPNVVINGRAARGLGRNFGDYLDTADRPAELRPTPGDWECIPTCNESYGYDKLDNSYKPPSHFIRLLAMAAAKGGNMLLNIGPEGDGSIDPQSQTILLGIGQWMSVNSQSIYDTRRTPLDRQAWGESTLNGNTLYLHVFDWPSDGRLVVGGLQSDVSSAWLLSDPSKKRLPVARLNDSDVEVNVPQQASDAVDSVVVLKISGEIRTRPGRLLAENNIPNRLLAFDAVADGADFKYADGKAARYYVSGFSEPNDSISWNTRLNYAADFDVSLKYTTVSSDAAASFTVSIGNRPLPAHLVPTDSATDIQEIQLGRIKLPAGETLIEIRSTNKTEGASANIFEIDLTPHSS